MRRAAIRNPSDTIGFHESALNALERLRNGREHMRTNQLRRGIGATALVLISALVTSRAALADSSDCCTDLEARIAELEETTARKGNRKVSLAISGWVNEALFAWDDGVEQNAYIGTNFVEQSRFKFVGEAQDQQGMERGLHPRGWRAGPSLEPLGPGQHLLAAPVACQQRIRAQPRKSNWFLKTESRPTRGRTEWHGHLSLAR